ncbi:MAG: glycosyltransferase [Planctomycetes bacterium]|nr:glycosyltransferase [Planctomycetota bacterium]
MSARPPRVAVVSDTLDDVNGVALGLRRLAAACRRGGLPLDLVGAAQARRRGDPVRVDDDGVVRVPVHVRRSIGLYPEMTWGVPRVGPLARWLAEARVDLVQVATPGPMGLGALVAARRLGLPVLAQYHTDVPVYAHLLSGRAALGAVAARVVSWFYRQADLCLAPSAAVEARLTTLGVPPARVARVPRGIDLALFHPARRDRARLARLGLGGGPVVLYLGRLSREKGLPRLLAAWAQVRAARPDARLLLVGDGPLAPALDGPGVVRAGMCHGVDLAALVASADLLAFPSQTETFGNAVVEALASGLPAVVAAGGAAREHVVPGVNGLVVEGEGPAPLAAAIVGLLADPDRRACMGRAARRLARRHDPDVAARATFELYRRFMACAPPARVAG